MNTTKKSVQRIFITKIDALLFRTLFDIKNLASLFTAFTFVPPENRVTLTLPETKQFSGIYIFAELIFNHNFRYIPILMKFFLQSNSKKYFIQQQQRKNYFNQLTKLITLLNVLALYLSLSVQIEIENEDN